MKKEKKQFIMWILLSALIALPLYIFLHESGHAIIAIIGGAENVRISILRAEMTSDLVSTPFISSLLSAAGPLFPLIIYSIAILFFRCDSKSIAHICCFYVASPFAIFPILSWVFIPIIGMVSEFPPRDDVSNFIYSTGWHPLWVLLLASVLFTLMILLITAKGVPQAFFALAKRINSKASVATP